MSGVAKASVIVLAALCTWRVCGSGMSYRTPRTPCSIARRYHIVRMITIFSRPLLLADVTRKCRGLVHVGL